MFRDTRRKTLRNRVIFTALGVLVMTFGIWLNYRNEQPAQEAADTVNQVSVEEEAPSQEEADKTNDANVSENDTNKTEEENSAEGTDTAAIPETYLIKEVEGVVKVFLCREDGSEELYLITSIPFDLLSENDQQLLTDGVELKTEEDLGKFLENFDS